MAKVEFHLHYQCIINYFSVQSSVYSLNRRLYTLFYQCSKLSLHLNSENANAND